MKFWKNKNQKINYECTNLLWAISESEEKPDGEFWVKATEEEVILIEVRTKGYQLYRSGDVRYFGRL